MADAVNAKVACLEAEVARLTKLLILAENHCDDEGNHRYYGTYCRHDNHDTCKVVCKTCSSPCVCVCHIPGYQGT